MKKGKIWIVLLIVLVMCCCGGGESNGNFSASHHHCGCRHDHCGGCCRVECKRVYAGVEHGR